MYVKRIIYRNSSVFIETYIIEKPSKYPGGKMATYRSVLIPVFNY